MSLKSKITYQVANFFLQNNFFNEISNFFKNKNNLIIFDIGCYKGDFSEKILKLLKEKIKKIYLFDINKKVENYLPLSLKKNKNIKFLNLGLTNKKGSSYYHLNTLFESAGTSISNLVSEDKKWVKSRNLLLRFLYNKKINFLKKKVQTSTLDFFVKKNRITNIDILKVDIEGTENEFIEGSVKTLKSNKIKVFILEILSKKKLFNIKEKKIIKFLAKNNFILFKKKKILSISFLSDIKGADYFFIKKNFYKQNETFRYN